MSRNQRIKEALKTRGVTREALGLELGVTHSTITQRLNEEREIDSVSFLLGVARLTGYSVGFLYFGEEVHEWGYQALRRLAMTEAVSSEVNEPQSPPYDTELMKLQAEIKALKIENEVLRSALREIGSGRASSNDDVDIKKLNP